MALSGARNKTPFLPCLQLHLPHEAGDAVAPALFSLFAQRGTDPWAAVTGSTQMENKRRIG
jgi:hypothetical protein